MEMSDPSLAPDGGCLADVIDGLCGLRSVERFERLCAEGLGLVRSFSGFEAVFLSLTESPAFCEGPFWGVGADGTLLRDAAERPFVSGLFVDFRGPDGSVLGTLGLGVEAREGAEREGREVLRALALYFKRAYCIRAAEYGLQQKLELLRVIVDYLPSAIYVKDEAGRYVMVNRAMACFAGSDSPAELLGKGDRDLFVEATAFQHEAGERRVLNGGASHLNELEEWVTLSGASAWFLSTKVPLLNEAGEVIGLVGAATDVTEQKLAEDCLRESEDRFRVISETASDAILMHDSTGALHYSNRAAELMFGYDSAALKAIRQGDLLAERRRMVSGQGSVYLQMAKRMDGSCFPVEISTSHMRLSDRWYCVSIIRDVSEREQALKETRELTAAIDQSDDGFIIADAEGLIGYVNPGYSVITGYTKEEVVGKRWIVASPFPPGEGAGENLLAKENWKLHRTAKRKDGEVYEQDLSTFPVIGLAGEISNYVTIIRDITEEQALESELRQSQKLESIGQLSAGIAHEINTPIQFVGDNICFIKEAMSDLLGLQDLYRDFLRGLQQNEPIEERLVEIENRIKGIDLSYLSEELPAAVEQSMEGVKRVSTIVRAMKDFAHPGAREKIMANLNEAIETTVIVARNEWKYVAELTLDLEPSLPDVPCLVGEFNQVMLNLIVNARDAIAEQQKNGQGHIHISTRCDGDKAVLVKVQDDGGGIPLRIREQIFDPFFTTKEVGKGSGQGLSIAHAVIVKKHAGELWFETEEGVGTCFIIRLPQYGEVE
jgi:two-component system, NtrC family, sensor kinase